MYTDLTRMQKTYIKKWTSKKNLNTEKKICFSKNKIKKGRDRMTLGMAVFLLGVLLLGVKIGKYFESDKIKELQERNAKLEKYTNLPRW